MDDMSYQRSKAPLSLMEQLIMVFVFAFAAAVCLQAFVYSDNLSKDSTQKETASARATEVIEVCKAYHGDLEKAAGKLSAKVLPAAEDGTRSLEKTYEADGVKVVLMAQPGSSDHIEKGHVRVSSLEEGQDDQAIYEVDVAWQVGEQATN